MKKILITLILLSAYSLALFSQNARSILDKASEAFLQSGGVTANFTLNTKEVKSTQIFSQDGTVHMKGDKFKIEVPDAITWFDGKTQWIYVKDTEEVNVSNPTGNELQAISPSILFSLYKIGYDLKYNGEKKINGKTVLQVEMTAQNKKNDLKKVIVSVYKLDNTFAKIVLYDGNNMENTLLINTYKKDNTLSDSSFVFNKKEYPEAEIIDLR